MMLPTVFSRIGTSTMYIFGGVNIIAIVIVWALYPETNQRTLEEMNMVFAADSIWNWEAEKNFKILSEQNVTVDARGRRRSTVAYDSEKFQVAPPDESTSTHETKVADEAVAGHP